jgi:hypothetical protein
VSTPVGSEAEAAGESKAGHEDNRDHDLKQETPDKVGIYDEYQPHDDVRHADGLATVHKQGQTDQADEASEQDAV